jgi:hypothetical protein
MLTAPASTEKLLIKRVVPATQPSDFVNNDASDAEVVEDALDRLTMIVQQKNADSDYPIRLSDAETPTDALTHLPFDRASTFLAFNASKELVASVGSDGAAGPLGLALAASGGSALIGTVQSGTGATPLILRDYVEDDGGFNLLGFVSQTQKAALRAGTNTDDVAAGLQLAIDAATDEATAGAAPFPFAGHFGQCAKVFIPALPGPVRISNVNIYAPLTLEGVNPKGSRLIGVSGATGYLLNFDGFNAAASILAQGEIPGVIMRNLGLEGNNRQASYGAIYLAALAQSHFDNLNIELFTRESLKFYSSVLESTFSRITTRYCGNVTTGHPDINLFDEHAAAGERDAHNMLIFDKIISIFPFGHHFNLDTAASRALLTRDIFFNKIFCHAVISGGTGSEPVPTTAQESTSAFVIGSATGIHLTDVYVPVQGTAVPTIHQKAGTHATGPSGTIINGFRTGGRTAATADRVGIKLEVGDLSVDNARLQNCQEGSIVTSTGTSLYLGDNVRADEAASYAADTVVTKNLGRKQHDKAVAVKRVVIADAAILATDASLGNFFTCGMGATGRTMGAPTNPTDGQIITYSLLGVNAGVPTIMAWNAVFTLKSGSFGIGPGMTRTITFQYDAANVVWVETGRDPLPQGNVTLTDAAPVAVNALLGDTFYVTVTAARQIANPTNRTPGQKLTFVIIQDGTGGWAITWDTAYKNAWSDTGNTLGLRSTITFSDDDSTIYLTQQGAQSAYMA